MRALQDWLSSYKPEELFTENGGVVSDIDKIIPQDSSKRLGQRKEVYACYEPIKLARWKDFGAKQGTHESPMKLSGQFIDQVFVDNPRTVRLFSPDELESNKLDGALSHTGRNFQWDQYSRAQGGRVIEVLSEHLCQGFVQGYTLTGRVGIFPSYESFLGIIHTMMVQYSKFNKMVRRRYTIPLKMTESHIFHLGQRNHMAEGYCKHQLYRNEHLDSARAQRVFSSEPVLHLSSVEPESQCGSSIPPTRR